MIKHFDDLDTTDKAAILELATRINNRVEVLDQFEDDKTQCILVKFHTWPRGIVRCVLTGMDHLTAAAFRFIEHDKARLIVYNYLNHRASL